MRTLRSSLPSLAAFVALAAFGACARSGGPAPAPLEAVSPVPATSPPAWIVDVSPHGEAKGGAQIRVRFASDIVPLEALESAETQSALGRFAIAPALAGRFVLLTPRMVGFVSDGALPAATRIRVTLSAGLADLAGHKLDADYAWTFTTEALALSGLPGAGANDDALTPVGLRPQLGIDANVELDSASLLAHAALVPRDDPNKPVALQLAPTPTPEPSAAQTLAPGADEGPAAAHYDVVPVADLERGRLYDLRIGAGVAPSRGNVATTTDYAGKVRTYGALAFSGIEPYGGATEGGDGRFVDGAPRVRFTNPVDPKSAAAAIALVPAPQPGVPLLGVDDDGGVRINPYALQPATSYAISIKPDLLDRFGQRLGSPANGTFTTSDLLPDVWAPSGLSIFPASAGLELNVETTNLRTYRFASVAISPEQLASLDPSDADAPDGVLPTPSAWGTRTASEARNASAKATLALTSLLHGTTGMLAYGVAARTFRTRDDQGRAVWQEPHYTGVVQLTDIGVFAQWFPQSGLVRAQRLRDGAALAGATVAVYEVATRDASDTGGGRNANAAPCATGTTDATGTWRLDGTAFAACASTATSATEAPALLVIARSGTDWAYVRTTPYSGAYSDNFYAGWSAGVPNAHGTISSDRQLYQPGETAHFVGLAYFETNGVLARGRSARYALSMRDPNGTETGLGSATLDPYGAFSFSVPIGAHAPVGYYTISASGTAGERLDDSFRVAEFKPPNFKVDLSLDRDTAQAGTSVRAHTKSAYLFGAPVEGGRSRVTVTRRQATFAPQGWDAFAFGRSWYGPEQPPAVDPDVLQRESAIGPDGTSEFAIPVATDVPYAMDYAVESQTTDVSNLAVADTKSFTALPGDALVGLSGAFVAQAGVPFDVRTIVVDPHGAALAGRHVALTLQRREFLSATEDVEGAEAPRTAIHYVDVQHVELDSAATAQRATFTAPQPGSYRVRANLANAASDATATDLDLFIAGPGEAAWGESDPMHAAVKLDKTSYRPGDLATALVESPFAEAELSFSVIRHDVLYRETHVVRGAAPQIRFRVTPDMLPNAAVEVVLVRRGAPVGPATPASLGKLARVGFAPFDVSTAAKRLRVTLAFGAPSVRPAARQHVRVHLSDADGRPVRGEATLAVVNDAVLQLTGYRFPDLVSIVYADQPISMRWGDNRADVKLVAERRTVDKGFGFGGGLLAGPGSTRVRTHFAPLAYWNATLRTDANGDANVDVTLPDDLTTWRAMVLAYTADARFGTGDATFVATKPLVTNPLVPQFVRPGDRFSAGVAVTNVARGRGTYAVSGAASGGIAFAGAAAGVATSAPADAFAQAFRFPMEAGSLRDGRLQFDTALGDERDAFAIPLPVLARDVTESVVTTGTTAASASVPLAIGPDARGPLGALDVTLASTLLADALEPARTLGNARPAFATSLASRIAIAADVIRLNERYGHGERNAPLRAQVEQDLAALRALALPAGGFAEWPGAPRGETFSTAFVAVQLAQARAAGFAVGPDIAQAAKLLEATLADPSAECGAHAPACALSTRLEALETFGILGDVRTSFLADIYAGHAGLDDYEQVELARHLVKLPAWRAQGLALRDTLLERVYETGRRATLNDTGAFGETPVAGQAQVLGLELDSGVAPDRVDKALASLLALRRNGTWGCTCDDAEALNAIVAYADRQGPPPDFSATATLAGTTFTTEFHGYARTTVTKTFAGSALPLGRSALALAKTGTGTLHYVVALRYPVAATAAGAYAGIRIDRTLRAPGDAHVLASFGLALPSGATTVPPARVFAVDDVVTTDHPLDDVVIDDPLPAGFEAVDQTLETAPTSVGAGTDNWEIDYRGIERDRVLAFAHHLPAGVYAVHYLVRSVTPGTYAWPGARVELQYAPEEFGRTAATQLVVTP